jgi:D-alanine-D-alanine ligase
MRKINMYIEIVRSMTLGLSSMSQESCQFIYAVLARNYTRVRVTVVDNLADLETLAERQPDLVFLGLEFIPLDIHLDSEDPDKLWLSDYFDQQGIAYTGSAQLAHEYGRNKPLAKQRVLDAGLITSDFQVIKQNQPLLSSSISLSYPLFVKPTNRGGGFGINCNSIVHDFKELSSQVNSITTQFHSDSLVEEYLPGREFSVAILKDIDADGYLVMPIELVAPADINGSRLLSSKVKSSNTEQALEVTDDIIKNAVSTLALDSFHALGARDYGRIDIRLDSRSTPHFLEANLIPSLISGYGSFPKACKLNIGLEYEEMIIKITELGLTRSLRKILDIHEPIELISSGIKFAEVPLL